VSCARFRSALADLALGSAAAPELLMHTDSCPSCGETLATLRSRVALMDGELQRAGSAEPGPHFLTRVRSRLAEERRPTLTGARFLLPALAILAAIGFGLLLRRGQPVDVAPQQANLERPEPAAPEAPAPSLAPAAPPTESRRAVRPGPPGEAVLVDPAESAAVASLAARLDSGKTKAESLQMPETESKEMTEIAIAPLDVRPLDATPALEDSTERSPS